jgi:sec-independent protein translocase protein TatC
MAQRYLTLTGHLEELRNRIIISLAALLVCSAICLPFSSAILAALRVPARGALGRLVYFGPEEAFLVYMRIGVIAGLILSFPVIAYQAWAFVSPAVGRDLRRYAAYFVASSTLAFVSGCAFAFFVLLPAALKFLLGIGGQDMEPVISAARYISFVTASMLACGAVFEMPVAAFFLARAGVLTSAAMRRKFKYALAAIMIVAAVITPTADVFNMMLLALPMLVLYEVSIWVAFAAEKKRRSAYA